jgi:hypothetical protein
MKASSERPPFVRSESIVRCDYSENDEVLRAAIEFISQHSKVRSERILVSIQPVLPLICYSISQSKKAGYNFEDTIFIAIVATILIMAAVDGSEGNFVNSIDATEIDNPFYSNIAMSITNSLQKQSRVMRLTIGHEGMLKLSQRYKKLGNLFSTLWLRAILKRLPNYTIKTLCIDMLYIQKLPYIHSQQWRSVIQQECMVIKENKQKIMPQLVLPNFKYAAIDGIRLASSLFGNNMLDFVL